jgi:hypothetical protein
VAVVSASWLAGCTGSTPAPTATQSGPLPQSSESVQLDPAAFTVDITNRYWPMKPGQQWVYEETDASGTVTHDEVTVLDRTRRIAGVETRVVHDIATVAGTTVEDTLDWYAQDTRGNLWYFGEQTTAYRNGRPGSTEGSWQAGVAGAQPGVALPAAPAAGMTYRQEYQSGEAEDRALVLSTDEKVEASTGRYSGALLTRDTSPLEPELVELKWYVPDVGPVLTLTPSGEVSREVLVRASAGT